MYCLRREIIIQTEPETVWQTLLDTKHYGHWNQWILEAEGELRTGSTLALFIEFKPFQTTFFAPIVADILECNEIVLYCPIVEPGLLQAELHYQLIPAEHGGCRFVQTQYYLGPLSLLAKTIWQKRLQERAQVMNDCLKHYCERQIL